ncbi:MAG: DUF3558 domain-containing protein [Acidobacteriota bacterium]|nr:DUF3558 domain-containing protein [Acidobacteriota bacterium]
MRRISVSGVVLCGFVSATQAGAEKIIDPCQLVTRSEVQAVLGAPIASSTEGPRSPDRPVRICNFRSQNGKMMNVYVGPKDKARFDKEKKGHEAVAGIGDAAYGIPPGIVSFLKGSTNVLVQAMPADAVEFERVKALARAAAGRL